MGEAFLSPPPEDIEQILRSSNPHQKNRRGCGPLDVVFLSTMVPGNRSSPHTIGDGVRVACC